MNPKFDVNDLVVHRLGGCEYRIKFTIYDDLHETWHYTIKRRDGLIIGVKEKDLMEAIK